jgi:hypothetical protein
MTSGGLPDPLSDTPILHEIRIRAAFDEASWDVARDQAALADVLDTLFRIGGTTLWATALEST